MQCQFAQELFSDHISDALDRAQKVSLDNHLAACADCREQVAGLRDVFTLLDAAPTVEPPKFFHENIMDRIATEAAKEQEVKQAVKSAGFNWRSLFGKPALALGAAGVVVILGFFGASQTQRGSLNPFASGAGKAAPQAPLTLQKSQAVWVAGGVNGGSVTVTLRANPFAGGASNLVNFQVMQAGSATPLKSGIVSSDREISVSIPLASPPAPDSLSITLTDRDAPTRTTTQPLTLPAQ